MPASVEQQLPDLNYVLDYNPEDEQGEWVGEYRREPESPYWNDYQSPIGTWKEAQAALLEYHAERSMQQGPEGPVGLRWVNRYIRSRLEGATPNQEFYLDSDDPEVVKAFIETYQTSERPYHAFWRIRDISGGWGKEGKTAEVVAPDQVMPDLDNVLDYEPQESWEGIWHSYSPRYQTPAHNVNWHTSGLWDDCREGLENLLESIWNQTQYAPQIMEQLKMAQPGQPFAWHNPYNKEDDWVKIEIRQMRTAKVAGPGHVPLAPYDPVKGGYPMMPDTNYVLDYNPEDIAQEGWKASVWGPINEEVWKRNPEDLRKKLTDHAFSPEPISWQEAWEWLNQRWNRKLVPEVGPALDNAVPDQEFSFKVPQHGDFSILGIGVDQDVYNEWRIDRVGGGTTSSFIPGWSDEQENEVFTRLTDALNNGDSQTVADIMGAFSQAVGPEKAQQIADNLVQLIEDKQALAEEHNVDDNVRLWPDEQESYIREHFPEAKWKDCPECGAKNCCTHTNWGWHCFVCDWWENGGRSAKVSMAMTPEMFQSMLERTPVLYHVTEPNRVGWIQQHGIVPGSEVAGATENVHQPMGGIPAREGAVYLWTDERHALDGAVWFLGIQSSDPAIFHIDASKLDPSKIEADEDYISSDPTMFNEIHGGPTPDDYYGDTEGTDWSGYDPWEIAAEPGNDWAKTHPMLGEPEVTWGSYDEHKTVAYVGTVPPEAIIKVELMSEMMDRGVDQGNARERGFFGEPYKRETRKIAEALPESEAELVPDFGYGWKILRVVSSEPGKSYEDSSEYRYDVQVPMNPGATLPDQYALISPSQGTLWPVEGLQADYPPPEDETAGIYVVDDPTPVLRAYDSDDYRFIGMEVAIALVQCQIWGRCMRHKAGYRAEYAKPYHIRLRESNSSNPLDPEATPSLEEVAKQLRQTYKCDVTVEDYRERIDPNAVFNRLLGEEFTNWSWTRGAHGGDTVIYPDKNSSSAQGGVQAYMVYASEAGDYYAVYMDYINHMGHRLRREIGYAGNPEDAFKVIVKMDKTWRGEVQEWNRQMDEADDRAMGYDNEYYGKLAEFDQWQGAGNWATWTVNGAIEGNWGSEIYYALQKFMQTNPTQEQFEMWMIEHVVGPFNKERQSEAYEWNSFPEEERIDHSNDYLREKQPDWDYSQLDDVSDIDLNETQINPWEVNWELLYQWAQRDFGVTAAVNPVNYEHSELTPHEMGLFDRLEPRERKLWRDRAENLNRRARATGDPGRVNGRALHALAERFNNQCAYCDKPLTWGGGGSAETGRNHPQMMNDPSAGTFDHNHPLKEGGSGGIENVVPACWRCNQDINEWDKSLKPEIYSPSLPDASKINNPLLDADPFNPFEI